MRGKHELKFGFNWMTTRSAFFTPPKPVGSYNFNGSYTGYGLSDFLYGRPISSQIDITKYFTLTRYRPVSIRAGQLALDLEADFESGSAR